MPLRAHSLLLLLLLLLLLISVGCCSIKGTQLVCQPNPSSQRTQL